MATKSDVDTVVTVFEKSKNVSDRNSFVRCLFHTLPRIHLRELVHHAASLDFRFDIIGSLPTEILCLVFMNLDIYQIFQLRRVSKRWLAALSAPQIVQSMLCPWFSMGPVDLQMPLNLSYEESLAIKAEHVDAFKTGNPFSILQGTWTSKPAPRRPKMNIRNVEYSHGRLAWLTAQQLHVRTLASGQELLYGPFSGEKIQFVRLSPDIVAAVTFSGNCYVWEHAKDDPHVIRLPSGWFMSLAVFGKSLAVVTGTTDDGRITTWTWGKLRPRSFRTIQRNTHQTDHSGKYTRLLMTDDSVLLIQGLMGPPDEIFYARYNLEGEVMAQGTSGRLHRTFRSGYIEITIHPQVQATRTRTRMDLNFPSLGDRQVNVDHSWGVIRVIYDLHNDRLEPLIEASAPYSTKWTSPRFFWKNVILRFDENEDRHTPHICHHSQTATKSDVYMQQLVSDLRHKVLSAAEVSLERVYGDEVYMVSLQWWGFTAFCFDKYITMAGENKDYRRQREAGRLGRVRVRDISVRSAQT